MTWRSEQIGDRGQRYMVEAEGYPKEGEWSTIGYTDLWPTAQSIADSMGLAPGCTATRITDRNPRTARGG